MTICANDAVLSFLRQLPYKKEGDQHKAKCSLPLSHKSMFVLKQRDNTKPCYLNDFISVVILDDINLPLLGTTFPYNIVAKLSFQCTYLS